MKRNVDRTTVTHRDHRNHQLPGETLTLGLETARVPTAPYNIHNDIRGDQDSNNGGLGGCLGGWISSFLGDGRDGSVQGGGGGTTQQDAPFLTNMTQSATFATAPPPRKKKTNDDLTDLVAMELNNLSLQEREVVYEDLHGVSIVEDESNQELVIKRLYDMKVELETKIPKSKKIAYSIAMEEFGNIGKDFVQDPTLHIMFLRADRWDSKKAAIRFVGWLDWKLELFGRKVLCHRHITLDMLEKDTRSIIEAGWYQILPQRDTSGRTVVFDRFRYHYDRSVKSQLQVFWYMMMAAVEDDIVAQQMGIVYVLYAVDGALDLSANGRKVFWDCAIMGDMLPARFNSLHFCFDNPKLGSAMKLVQTAVGPQIRARFRTHEGTHTEVQYSLMTYGLPSKVLPVTADGSIKTNYHLKWYKRRKARDSAFAKCVGGGRDKDIYGIDLPGRMDVLFGVGQPIRESPGNRRLQELVQMYYLEYGAAEKGQKRFIAERIVQLIQQPSPLPSSILSSSSSSIGCNNNNSNNRVVRGPRFLKRRKDGWWEPVPDKVAIDKVGYAIRNLRFSVSTGASSSSGVANTSQGRTTTTPLPPPPPGAAQHNNGSAMLAPAAALTSGSGEDVGAKRCKVSTTESESRTTNISHLNDDDAFGWEDELAIGQQRQQQQQQHLEGFGTDLPATKSDNRTASFGDLDDSSLGW